MATRLPIAIQPTRELWNYACMCVHTHTHIYSETSNNGLSERWTTSVQQTKSMPPIALL